MSPIARVCSYRSSSDFLLTGLRFCAGLLERNPQPAGSLFVHLALCPDRSLMGSNQGCRHIETDRVEQGLLPLFRGSHASNLHPDQDRALIRLQATNNAHLAARTSKLGTTDQIAQDDLGVKFRIYKDMLWLEVDEALLTITPALLQDHLDFGS